MYIYKILNNNLLDVTWPHDDLKCIYIYVCIVIINLKLWEILMKPVIGCYLLFNTCVDYLSTFWIACIIQFSLLLLWKKDSF